MLSMHSCPLADLGHRDTGGMNVYIRQLAERLGDYGVNVDIYSRMHNSNHSEVTDMSPHVKLIHLPAGSISVHKDDLDKHIPEFVSGITHRSAMNGSPYDLIHSHYWLSGEAGCLLSSYWGIPHVTTFHTLSQVKQMAFLGGKEPKARVIGELRIASSADAIVVSDVHEKNLLMTLYGIREDSVNVIPSGVDLDQFRPLDHDVARKRIGVVDKKLILFVGRLDPLKGIDLLLRAVSLLEDDDNIQLCIVGGDLENDPEAKRLSNLTQALGLSDKVRFEGLVPHEELPWYYNAAAVSVVPSYYESFGLTVLESLACGTPVIASRVGGIPSLVRDGETGYLVPWRRPESFAQRLEFIFANETLRTQMGKTGINRAKTMGWDQTVIKIKALYDELLGQHHADSRT